MIKDIQELNFPSYATMSAATVSLPDMGEWNITSQIKIDGQIAPDFSFDWEVVHDGHKYIMPLRKPQGSKENKTLNSVIDLTFQHWAIYQLKRWYFFNLPSTEAGVAWKKYITPVSLNLGDFCGLFEIILNYYYGDKITLDLNPQWEYKSEPETISISYTKLWSVITEVFYKQFGVRWKIEPNGSPDKYVIKVGYPTTEQSHIFEYGFQGGLMKVERQVQSEEIVNMLLGCGGEKNLPYRYYKNVDPENDTFPADPDWIEELATTYFSNLMPATFRSYVQGWKAAHISKYPGYTAVGEANAYAPWAYRKGYTDTKFDPVEYVADEITINPETGDKQVAISPTYSPYIKKGSSIAKYGPLLDGLDNNDDIYPTIQGVVVNPYGRIDEVVEVEPITSDDIEESAENDAQVSNVGGCRGTISHVAASAYKTFTIQGATFTVPSGKTANLDVSPSIKSVTTGNRYDKIDIATSAEITDYSIKVYGTNGEVSASGISGGAYRYEVTVEVHNMTTDKTLNITVGDSTPKLTPATLSDKWSSVWRIWVKNIWQTSKQSGETDAQYAERVWRPILGDRAGNEAKVVFASGMLAHEDYEFVITSIPKYERKKCTWQTVENGQVVNHEYWSEWCIELGKSDAELDTLGVYLPSTMRQAKAGDFFFFIGIDMPHLYVKWGEERVDNWKKDNLQDKKDIKPTWVVQTDRVRLNNEGKPDALIRLLHPGDTLRLADKRFIEGDYETLYLSSLTITYREPTKDDAALNPDVEIVLSDRYEVSANPVATLQGEVSALAKQVGSISNVEQIVRAVCDKLYLRKDGLPDRSLSPTEFASLLTSMGFRSGIVGGAGWGVYKDANGNWVIEADRLLARQDLEVNSLVINQVTGQGGTIVESAARMEITKVVERTNGYACYFDQKGGSVANLFHVDDIAWNNRFTAEDEEQSFYRRRVIEVGADYVLLSKTDVNGTGIPAEGDVIVQRGNYTDANRQYIKVRDVIGGGFERYIEGLDSVNAEGVQYHFVGRQNSEGVSWFVGNRDLIPYSGLGDGSFIEYKDREFNLNNVVLSIGSKIGDKTFTELIESLDNSKYLREALNQSTDVINGLVLTSAILLGRNTDLGRETWAGHNGLYLNSKTIASWWGGDMIDRFYDEDGAELEIPLSLGYAAALVRMDGSAYWAKGNIGFEADGSGWLGNYENGIRFGSDGSLVLGQGLTIALNGSQEGLAATLESVLNQNIGIAQLFAPIDENGNELPWSQANSAVAIKAKKNFLSVGEITAYGTDGGSSSGSNNNFGYLHKLLDVNISLPSDGQFLVYRNGQWVNESVVYGGGGLDETELASYLSSHGYVTSGVLGDYVTVNTEQEIAGKKTFTADRTEFTARAQVNGATTDYTSYPEFMLHIPNVNWAKFKMDSGGMVYLLSGNDTNWGTFNAIKAAGFVKSGGTSSQFLKADGSVDSTVYLASASYTASDILTKLKTVDGAGSGLDADLLDGLHAADFVSRGWDYISGGSTQSYVDWMKAHSGIALYSSQYWNWSMAGAITTPWGSINSQAYSALVFRQGNLNNAWQMNAVMFLPAYTDTKFIYIGQAVCSDTAGVIAASRVLRYADYDTVLESNVASASKLANSRTIWGQSFNGEGDVTGSLSYVTDITMSAGIVSGGQTNGAYIGCASGGLGAAYTGGLFWAYGNSPLYFYTNSALRMLIASDGNVCIGTTTPVAGAKLHVQGNILSTAEITAYSDIRLKSEISTIVSHGRLRPVSFIKDGARHVGLIAQEVQLLCPDVVREGEYLSLNYTGALCYALSGVYSEIDELKEKNRQLQAKVEQLERRIA